MSATADQLTDSAEPILLREDDQGVVTLTLNRPAQYNALSSAMLDALHDAEDKTQQELIAAERLGGHQTMGTPDAMEGITAFLEKRRPVFNKPQTG